jgi:phage terminase small subunit
MAKTGRKPYETSDVVAYMGSESRRLRPPTHLGPRERAVFLDLVTSVDPRQFRNSDIALLSGWSELVVMGETAAEHLRSEGMVLDGNKPSPWLRIHEQAVKGLGIMSLRLRISPQARAPKAPKTVPAPTSYYDRMELEGSALEMESRARKRRRAARLN